jgi:hypothetical protein
VESPANSLVIERVCDSLERQPSVDTGVTVFASEDRESPEETCLRFAALSRGPS